jgi:GNAT superfamily N-acetyltransferase
MRRVEKTRLTLEMLSPGQLIRAKPQPDSRLRLRTVSESDPVLERLFREVGAPHLWSWESWSTYGAPPAKRNWLIQVDEKPAGLLTLLALPEGDVEMVTFGLLPRYQGRGLGGQALTLATELAWSTYGPRPSRVWLHTNNFDHPHALLNYQARGFVVVDVDVRTVTVPDGWHSPGPSEHFVTA